MSSRYVIWQYQPVPAACVLKDLVGLEETFRLPEGVPLQKDFPQDAAFHMHPDFPDDLVLTDSVRNSSMCLVVSPRLKASLEAQKVAHVEYLPVAIVDHRSRVAASDYCIAHPIEPVDCIDREQSVFEESLISDDQIDEFTKLVIDESRVPSDRQLFRMKGFWDIVLVRSDLADSLSKEGFTGVKWLPIDKYPPA